MISPSKVCLQVTVYVPIELLKIGLNEAFLGDEFDETWGYEHDETCRQVTLCTVRRIEDFEEPNDIHKEFEKWYAVTVGLPLSQIVYAVTRYNTWVKVLARNQPRIITQDVSCVLNCPDDDNNPF